MERLGDDARRLMAAAGAGGNYRVSVVTNVWRDCVGETIARAAWPSRVARDGTLHVTAVSSTWAFELERLSPEIAERLSAALGEDTPTALRFAPGRIPEPAADPAEITATPPEITPAMRAEGDSVAAGIADSGLRALVARAAAASLSRGGSDRGFC